MSLIKLTFVFQKEEDQWVGTCQELGTSTYGEDIEEVKSELAELVELHLNTLEELNERKRFFAENNIEIYSKNIPHSIDLKIDYKPDTPDTFVTPYFTNVEPAYC